MDSSQVEYSTKPVTLQQHIWMQKAVAGDYEAMLFLIIARTNIGEEKALNIEDDDLVVIIGEIAQGMQRSMMLSELGKGLGNA